MDLPLDYSGHLGYQAKPCWAIEMEEVSISISSHARCERGKLVYAREMGDCLLLL